MLVRYQHGIVSVFIIFYLLCACETTHPYQGIHMKVEDNLEDIFTIWVLCVELRSLGLEASTLNC